MRKEQLKGKHCLSLENYTKEEINLILDTADDLKRKLLRGEPHEVLRNKSLGMVFGRKSTRTRVSFETAMTQLGGHAQYLEFETLHESRTEPPKDTIRVLSQYLDGICIRGGANFRSPIQEYAKFSTIPVIEAGGETHPCQVLSDLLTIREKRGRLEGIKLVVAWGPCFSYNKPPSLLFDTMFAGARLGMEIVVACPEGYDPYSKEVMSRIQQEASIGNAIVKIMRNLEEAVARADVIHSKNWVPWNFPLDDKKSPHQEEPENYRHWIVDTNLLKYAKKDVIVMHAMPAHRGEELTDEVIEGPHSAVIDEAGNRLHAQKALLALLMQ